MYVGMYLLLANITILVISPGTGLKQVPITFVTIQSVFDYSETSKYLRSAIFLLLKGNVIMDYIENISQKEPVPSYLPSWVIKMR